MKLFENCWKIEAYVLLHSPFYAFVIHKTVRRAKTCKVRSLGRGGLQPVVRLSIAFFSSVMARNQETVH